MFTCMHCGQLCGDYPAGYAAVPFVANCGIGYAHVCHPNDPERPDCYRRITLYHEPIGALQRTDPKPAGITDIQR